MRPHRVWLCALLFLSLSTLSFAAPEAEWPQWLGPDRDGKSPDTGLLKTWPEGGPPLLWKAGGIGKGYSGVAVANKMVYVTGDIGDEMVMTAFDMDGNEKWKERVDKAWEGTEDRYPGARATPTIDGSKLYLLSCHGLLGCYSAKTGSKKWTISLPETFGSRVPGYGYSESVLVYKKTLYCTPGGKNCIVALKASNGKPIWTSKGLNDGAAYSSLVLGTYKRVPFLLQVTGKGMVCVSAKNGRFFWRNERVKGEARTVCCTPAYHDGYCFAASGYNNGGACVKLKASRGTLQGEQVWDTKDMVNYHGGYIIHEGHLFGNHAEGYTCLDLKTGEKRWFVKGVGKGSLCYADGMLYLFNERDGRAGLLPATLEEPTLAGEFKVEGKGRSYAHPVVIGGRLYLRYDDNLYVYNVQASE